MRVKTVNVIEQALKDTGRYVFKPQIQVGSEWQSATPDGGSINVHLENPAGESLVELPYIDLGSNEFAVDFYADDSIFSEELDEPEIEVNKEFSLAFYWAYSSNGHTIEKCKRFIIKIVRTN